MQKKWKRENMSKEFIKIAEDILKNLDNYTGRQKEFYVRTGI